MQIAKLSFQNYRSFREFSLTLPKRVTLIVAMNGVGKTSVVEGLANALGAFKRGSVDRQGKPKLDGLVEEADHRREWITDLHGFRTEAELAVEVSAEWGDSDVSWQLTSHSPIAEQPRQAHPQLQWLKGRNQIRDKVDAAARDNDKILPLLLGLRAKRLSRGEKKPFAPYGERTASAPDRLPAWAAEPYFDKDWYTLRTTWATLISDQTIGGAHAKYASAACGSISSALMKALELETSPIFSPDESDFVIQLPDDDARRLVGLMSDGWRAYVTIVAGLAMRCAEINPLRANAPEITPGVLIIDELEQHLHPHLQLEILDGLRRAFPLLQIIATTHSPLILTDAVGAGDNSIVRLDRDENGEIVPKPLIAPAGKNVLQVLTGDWFGLPSTYDDETLRMLAEHRELLRKGPAKREDARALADQIRTRIGRYAETSVEEMVLSIVAELERQSSFEKLTHPQICELREKVLGRIKAELP